MAKGKKTTGKKQTARRSWPPHLKARLRQLRRRMRHEQLDAILVCDPHDIRYLTGFSGEDSWALVRQRTVIVLSDTRFEQELKRHCPYLRTVMRRRSLSEELGKLVKDAGVETLAVQAEHVTLQQRQQIARHAGAGRLKPVAGWLIQQRAAKDEHDLAGLRRAIRIQERAYRSTLDHIRPGMTERQVAALLEYNMRQEGADGTGFPTIVASGPNAALPHYLPQNAKVKKNTPLLIDFGATRDGYNGDLTRVVVPGRMPKRMAEVYRVTREAQLTAIDAIAPGVPLAEVDAAARSVIESAGYGKYFGHGLGHGLGLEVHEEPRLSPRAEGELEPGHVVTVEPGIYLPGVGGVRIEDDVLVTDRGRRKLSSLPTGPESAII